MEKVTWLNRKVTSKDKVQGGLGADKGGDKTG